jgi:ADP-L-glycero-D-manno-heptose 6-epimerase
MIILTGGAGFIGSCILSQLNQMGRTDVVIVDHIDNDDIHKKKNLENKRYEDFIDKRDFLQLILKEQLDITVDKVIHMGACSSTTLNDAQYFRENNFEYSCALARWALHRRARFVYASSAATYGDGSLGYSDEDHATRRLRPLNLYGDSKQKFDLWVLGNSVADKMVGLKFFNVFGPNEYHKGDMQSVVAKSYQRVVEKGKMVLFKSYNPKYKDGEQKRDFIYVKDAVNVVMFFLEHPTANGIFNVGTGLARTWNDLAHALFTAVGKKPHVEYIEMPEELKEKYQYFTQADITKLRNSGYSQEFQPLEKAIKDYAGYLKVGGRM